MEFIPYAQQHILPEDIQSAVDCFASPIITRGPQVEEFEKKCAAFCHAKYAVVFNSGTSALSAASYALDISSSDTIVSSPNTFVGTLAEALKKTSHLQLLDIDLKTGSPNFNAFIPASSNRHILFMVHFAGIAQKIKNLPANCYVIEDACQAFGSKYLDGSMVGSCPHSEMTVFSFHPAKTICTGEGGLVTTNSKQYYDKLRLYRNNGMVKEESFDPWIYQVVDLTTNTNFTDFQAALGLSQLKRIDQIVQFRQEHAARYRKHFKECDWIQLLDEKYDPFSAHNLFVTLIDFKQIGITRKEFMTELKAKGIGTQVHFIPLYKHPYFKKHFQFDEYSFPNTESYYERELSLPLFTHLKDEQIDHVCQTILDFCHVIKST